MVGILKGVFCELLAVRRGVSTSCELVEGEEPMSEVVSTDAVKVELQHLLQTLLGGSGTRNCSGVLDDN